MSDYSTPMFQFTGVTSGIEWGDMIDTIMAAARKPVEVWEAQQDTLELKIGLYEEFSAVMKTMQSTLTSLKLPSTFRMKATEVTSLSSGLESNAILTATATTDAYLGEWDIEVLQKATTEQRVGTGFSSASEALGISGTFYVRVGSQRAEIEVKSTDSLREINLKISQAVDDHGNALNISSKLIDNHLVLTSAFSGLGSSTGSSATVTRGSWTDGEGGSDYLPLPGDGSSYPTITAITYGSTTYTEGTDYTYDQSTGTITWLSGGSHPSTDEDYTITFDGEYTWNTNTFALEEGTGDVLTSLGLNIDDDEHYSAAQDAILLVDGVRVTRSSNEIDDLIGGVTLNLKGPGKVILDITTDMEEAVTAIQAFVDAYNEVMEWINIRLSEESDEDAETDFDKKFGLLHGDSLLWQAKSQLRQLISDPQNILGPLTMLSQIGITTESTDYGKSGLLEFDSSAFMEAATPGSLDFLDQWMTDALEDSDTPLNELKTGFSGGTFSIAIGGKSTTITVNATDTLTDINLKIAAARDTTTGTSLALRSTIVNNTLAFSSRSVDEDLSFQDPDGVLLALGMDISDPDDSAHHAQYASDFVGDLVTTIMSKLDDFCSNMVDSTQVSVGTTVTIKGRIASRIDSLTTQITNLDERIAAFEERLATKERGLNAQYSQMETILAELNEQAEWLSSTLSALSSS
ncbi:flagellar filament capping protein FliD [Aminiphilus circumscriptus]|uniref:flagellar filament capping protein FliD n=1 Tax=Aminiphilus circumscriptus TaxID=290732 RepID=UPI0004BB8D58|nr:flagellar filament capping protein FliD [Aminiphilus circumscriptus]